MPIDNDTIKVTTQEKNEIKDGGVDSLPLNPTAQGFSGQEIRKRLAKSITANTGSVLSLAEQKLAIVADKFDEVDATNEAQQTQLDNHVHDDRYYTETEIDNLIALYDLTTIVDAKILAAKKIHYYPNTKNTSGSLIPKGAVVQFNGSQGDFILIKQAVASEINAQPEALMGLAENDIADNQFGNVVWFGQVIEVNVNPAIYNNGDILYFNTLTGGLTNVRPSENIIIVAAVEKVSNNENATNGILIVRPKWLSRNINEVDGLRAELDTIEADIDTLEGYDLDTRLTAAEADIDDLQPRMTTAEGAIDSLEGRMDTAESDIDSLEGRMDTAEADIDAIEADYVHNTSEIAGNLTIEGNRVDIISNAGNIYLEPSNNDAVVVGNLKVEGDLIIDGESIVVDFEQVTVANNTITLRDNAVSGLGSGFAGLIAKNADGSNDSGLLFNGDGIARVGDITVTDGVITNTSNTQALATREDSPVNNGIAHWDSATSKFETNANALIDSGGSVYGSGAYFNAYYDKNNTAYYLNPASTGTSITVAGNVGIGTTSPDSKLHIYTSSGRQTKIYSGAADLEIQSDNNSAPVVLIKGTGNADLLNVFDNTTEVFTILDGGNVGIGTTSPNQQLEVKGAGLTYVKISSAVNTSFRGIAFGIENNATMNGSVAMEVSSGELRTTSGYTGWGGFQTLYTNGLERMRITSGGNVGIGTTSPHTKLTTKVSNSQFGNVTTNTDNQVRVGQYVDGVGAGRLYLYDENNTNDVLINTNGTSHFMGGNVGIGTTSPAYKLDVIGNSRIVQSADTGFNGLIIQNSTQSVGSALRTNPNNSLTLRATGTDTMTLLDGNVGIGTASPVEKLTIDGSIKFLSNNNGFQFVNSGDKFFSPQGGTVVQEYLSSFNAYTDTNNNNPSTDRLFNVYEGNTYASGAANLLFTILKSGNVGIGTTSPNSKLHVVGNVRIEHPIDNVLTFTRASANTFTFEHDLSKFYLYNSTTTIAPLVVLNNSNIGIGTTSPSYKLDISGNTQINGGTGVASTGVLVVRQNGDTLNNGIAITSSNVTSHRIWKDSDGKLNIGTSALPSSLVQDLSGNVGIANTNPQEKLDVTGNARVSGQYQYGTAAYTEYNSTDQTIDFVFN